MPETYRVIYDNKSQLLHQVGTSPHLHKSSLRSSINAIKHNACTSKAGISYYHSYWLWTSILFTENPVKRSKFFRQDLSLRFSVAVTGTPRYIYRVSQEERT